MDAKSWGLGLWGAVTALGALNMALFVGGMERADNTGTGGAFTPLEWCLAAVWVVVAVVAVGYTVWFVAGELRAH